MKSLEIKIAYLDENSKIIERNKEFYGYFEKAGFLYESIVDIVVPEQKNDFLNFVRADIHENEFRSYLFKKITGEYFYNIVFVVKTKFNDKECRAVHITDISRAVNFFNDAVLSEKKINCALALTSEYLFSYQKSTNIFRIRSYQQSNQVFSSEQDIDSWKTRILSDGLISKESIDDFEVAVNELKECNEDFSARLNASFRYEHSLFEKVVLKAVRFEDNGEIYMLGRILPEVFAEQMKTSELLEELKIDALTGTYNKKAITEFAKKRFAEGTKENAMLLIVDLDHFKPVNDAYGHLAGDKVLKKAGDILKNIVGNTGLVGRYGGDEFLIILENMDEESDFRAIMRTINFDIRAAFENMFVDIKVTASIGASMYKKDGETFDELFKKADFCLYRAKDKGRDRYVFYREDLHGELYKKASEAKTEGIKYDVREVLELKSMADFLLELGANPKPAADTVLAHMLKTYNLDSINIYYGKKMERRYCIGQKPENLSNAEYVFSQDFKDALREKSFIRINFITELGENAKSFGKILDQRGVKSSIQLVLGSPQSPLGLITFDRLKEGALWAEYEVNCCVMFAAAVNLLPEEKILKLFE